MANVAKKRTVVVASSESPSPAKQQTVPRQRGIPTRVHRNDDRKPDLNRNSRPSSLTNFTDGEFCSNDNAVNQSQDSELDNENGKHRKGAILKPGSCLSVPFKVLRRTNSPKRSLESDNRSQLAYLLSSCNNNDADKSVDKGKSTAAIDSSKSRLIYKQNFECPHSIVNHSASYHSSSKSSHSKPPHVRKSLDSGSQVKSVVFTKEMISLSADHLALQDSHGTDPGVEMTSSISSVISDPVKKHSLKQNSDVLSNGMMSTSAAFGKRSLRSRSEMSKSEPRSNLRPRSSGPATVSHHKTASGDRSPLRKDSRKQSVHKKSSETFSMDSSEGEQGVGKRRKNSGNTGQRTSECTEQDEPSLHVSGIQKVHFSARNQNLPTDLGGKFGRMTRSQKAEVNSVPTSKKGNPQSQDPGAKCSSVPKINISHEPSPPESRQVITLSDLVNHSDIPVTCKTSESLENDGEACQIEQSFCDNRALEGTNSLNGYV